MRSRCRKAFGSWRVGLLAMLLVAALVVRAAEPAAEYVDKAASLALFPDFVKWPSGDNAPVLVGILGEDPFAGALNKLNPKRARSIEELRDCKVIFITRSEHAKVAEILEALGSAHVLTVGETEGFAKQGGVIGFVVEGGRVRFEINTGAARRAGLGIDLRLLKLALRVFSS